MTNKRTTAVVTLAIGEFYEKMAVFTHPLMKQFAEKCDSDFIVINEPRISKKTSLPPKYEKFQIADLLDIYERILFVDTDIIVLPTTPNLFQLVPGDKFAAVSEESFSGSKLEKKVTQAELGAITWENNYFNSGVMVIPRSAKPLFNATVPELKHWAIGDFRKEHPTLLNDQPYLNHAVNKTKTPYFELDSRFNHTRAMPGSNNRFNSYLVHFAGASGHRYGSRLKQIERDSKVASNSFLMNLSIKFPLYRYVADRMSFSFIKYLLQKVVA
jgi:lipopolysaccharide biosynthesis glycosyltransferase